MAVPIETLNAQLVAREVHTGVYKTHNARISVVVRVKGQAVHFLRLDKDCQIVLEQLVAEQFLREHPVELYHYPVLRAIRKYAVWVRDDGFGITDEARKVINAILVRR